MTNAESGLIAPMDPEAYSSPQCAQLMCKFWGRERGEGEETFLCLCLYFIGKLSTEEAQRVMRENYIR